MFGKYSSVGQRVISYVIRFFEVINRWERDFKGLSNSDFSDFHEKNVFRVYGRFYNAILAEYKANAAQAQWSGIRNDL